MAWAAIAGAAVTVVGGAVQANSARSAANQQADAANRAAQANATAQAPWLQAGTQALGTLQAGLAPGGQFSQPFTMADATNSAAEQEAIKQGGLAIDNSMAAKTGVLNSNEIDQQMRQAEATASQYEGQAFNQYNTQQMQQLGATQSLAGVGQTTSQNIGSTNANAILAAGNAGAAGTVGVGNALTNTTGTIANILGQAAVPNSSPSVVPTTPNAFNSNSTTIDVNGSGGGIPISQANDYGLTPSDARLKTDINQIAETPGGTPIYTFRMKSSPTKQVGVIAQDVERRQPEAVKRSREGYRMVDYGMVK
jgi:hypothetical protein